MGAAAQDAPVDRTAEARELFVRGLERMDRQDWAEAAQLFRQALVRRSTGEIRYNLALALAHDGRVVSAVALMQGVVRDRAASPDARARAQSLLDEMSPKLALLAAVPRRDRGTASERATTHREATALDADADASAAGEGSGSVLHEWWLWAGIGSVVVGTVAAVLLLALGGSTPSRIAPAPHMEGGP